MPWLIPQETAFRPTQPALREVVTPLSNQTTIVQIHAGALKGNSVAQMNFPGSCWKRCTGVKDVPWEGWSSTGCRKRCTGMKDVPWEGWISHRHPLESLSHKQLRIFFYWLQPLGLSIQMGYFATKQIPAQTWWHKGTAAVGWDLFVTSSEVSVKQTRVRRKGVPCKKALVLFPKGRNCQEEQCKGGYVPRCRTFITVVCLPSRYLGSRQGSC